MDGQTDKWMDGMDGWPGFSKEITFADLFLK